MIFPNKFQRDNYLKKQQLISFPNDYITQILAYEESVNMDTEIYAVASKKNLHLAKYKKDIIDGIYIYENKGTYKDIIQKCINQANCTNSISKFIISNQTDYPKVYFEFSSSEIISNSIRTHLKKKGIVSNLSDTKIVFYIKEFISYSNLIKRNINKYRIKYIVYDKNQKIKSQIVECSKQNLFKTIEDNIKDILNEEKDKNH